MAKVALRQNRKRKEDIGSWTHGWVLAAVAAGILIIFLGVGVTVVRASDTSVETVNINDVLRTPDVRNLSGEEAKKILEDKGLVVKIAEEVSSSVIPEGYIVKQTIKPGMIVSVGETIFLTVSSGTMEMPNFGEFVLEGAQALSDVMETQKVSDEAIQAKDEPKQNNLVNTETTPKKVIDWTTDSSLVNSPQYTCETKTEYRYQTRTKNMETTTSTSSSMGGWTMTGSSQSPGDWGAWSGWSESSVSGSDTRQVETRESVKHGEAYDYIVTEYRYRDRTVQTTYSYQREVYSAWSGWSEWQQGAVGANECTNVETRTLYKYTEK